MINDFMNDFKDSKEEYLIKEAPLDDMSTQGGEIKGYYIDNKLKYIDINIFGETGKIVYEIAYLNDTVVYFTKNEITYDKPIYFPDFTVQNEIISNYILYNKHIFEYNKELKQVSDDIELEYMEFLEDINNILSNY